MDKYLEVIAPVQAVRGNVDGVLRPLRFPLRRLVKVEQVTILMTHFGIWSEELAAWLLKEHGLKRPDVFVYGHSHRAAQHWEERTMYFNPGAAGRSRVAVGPSVGTLTVQGQEVRGYDHPIVLAQDALRAEGAQSSALSQKEEKKRFLDGMARVALRKQPELSGHAFVRVPRISYLPCICWTKNLRLPYVTLVAFFY